MNSPLVRVILTIFAGYLIILLFLSVYDWIKAEYPKPPDKPPNTERIQHSFSHEQAINALEQFSRLPGAEKDAIKKNLESSLISMEQWLTHLDRSDYSVICMGELHEESTRHFLSEDFFRKLRADVLMLEATPKKLKNLIKRMEDGRDYFPLLDADILNILRNVRDRNPDIKIWGIEETEEQQKEHPGHSGSRDQSIAQNFWHRFQPGMRHIILFGALHCTNESNWLFKSIKDQAGFPIKERMLNTLVLGEHQNGPLEAFVYFLDEIGIEKKDFVISDTRALHPRIYDLFQLLNRQILEKYGVLIVFRI
jgi:hypothetical protein